jgi:hypothetical protein
MRIIEQPLWQDILYFNLYLFFSFSIYFFIIIKKNYIYLHI